MLLLIKNFVKAVHGQKSDPGDTKLRYYLVCHCSFSTGRSSTNSNHKWLNLEKTKLYHQDIRWLCFVHLLSLAVIPRWPASCVDGSLRCPDNWFPLCTDGCVGTECSLPRLPGTWQRRLGRKSKLIQSQACSQSHRRMRTA